MKRNILGLVIVVSVVVGIVLGIAVAPWATTALSAQTITRFRVQRANDLIFIHDTKSNECYLAIPSGSIIQASC